MDSRSPFYNIITNNVQNRGSYTFYNINDISIYVPKGTYLNVGDWIPEEDPKPGDNFFGVDRSIDVKSLSGTRKLIENDIRYSIDYVCEVITRDSGIEPSHAFVPNAQYNYLLKPFNSWGYKALSGSSVKLYTSLRSIEIHNDPSLINDAYVLSMDTWSIDNTVICTNPGRNARIILNNMPKINKILKCECGSAAVGSSLHSYWCPIK